MNDLLLQLAETIIPFLSMRVQKGVCYTTVVAAVFLKVEKMSAHIAYKVVLESFAMEESDANITTIYYTLSIKNFFP